MRSDTWIPAWNHEDRPPSFFTNTTFEEEFREQNAEDFSVGMSLYASQILLPYFNAQKP
jgi:hypothetical protein